MSRPRRALALAALAGLAACGAWPERAGPDIPVVTAVLDAAAAAPSAPAEALRAALADSPLVYLDLTVRPDADGAYGAALAGASGPFVCDGWQRIDGAPALLFQPVPGDNHALLTIERAGAGAFGLLACEYDPSRTDVPVLRVQGFFAVTAASVPTAVDLRLRSAEVDAATAARTLRR